MCDIRFVLCDKCGREVPEHELVDGDIYGFDDICKDCEEELSEHNLDD